MILTVTLNPSVDHALFVDGLQLHDTNRVHRTERDAGGKGINVARVAAEMGASVLATGFLAGGPGAYVRQVLDNQGVRHDFIEVEGETRINFSVEDGSGKPPTTFNEPGPEVSLVAFDELIAKLRKTAADVSWVVLGGSLPPGLPPDAFAQLVRVARELGKRVVLDADGEAMRLGIQAGPTFVKPNSKEAERLLGKPVETESDAIDAARTLLASLDPAGNPIVVLSRGQEGAVLATSDGTWTGRSPKVEAKSTIGSGDSMIGGILSALGDGHDLLEAFRYGLAAGAATATTDGSEIARKSVVLRLLDQAIVVPAT